MQPGKLGLGRNEREAEAKTPGGTKRPHVKNQVKTTELVTATQSRAGKAEAPENTADERSQISGLTEENEGKENRIST